MKPQKNDPREAARYFSNKVAFTTLPAELGASLRSGKVQVVDLRAVQDFARGHVPGAVSLPEARWDSLEGLARGRVNVLLGYGPGCPLAARAAVKFAREGYSVMELEGGFKAWREQGMDVATSSPAVSSREYRESLAPF